MGFGWRRSCGLCGIFAKEGIEMKRGVRVIGVFGLKDIGDLVVSEVGVLI